MPKLPDLLESGHFFDPLPYYQASQDTNDGRDFFGRVIEVDDLVVSIEKVGNSSKFNTSVVTRIGFGKDRCSVAIKNWWGNDLSWSDSAVRYSRRLIILERNYHGQ